MISKNGIEYDYKVLIKQNGKPVGWRLYTKNRDRWGLSRFVGYLWKTKSGRSE